MLSFIVGYLIGLMLCFAVYLIIDSFIQKHNNNNFKKYLKEQRNNIIRDSDGEIIWRGDIGLCGKAVNIG